MDPPEAPRIRRQIFDPLPLIGAWHALVQSGAMQSGAMMMFSENMRSGGWVSEIPGLAAFKCRCHRHRTRPNPGTVWDGGAPACSGSLGEQAGERLAVARGDALAVAMSPVVDEARAAALDRADRGVVGREKTVVEAALQGDGGVV